MSITVPDLALKIRDKYSTKSYLQDSTLYTDDQVVLWYLDQLKDFDESNPGSNLYNEQMSKIDNGGRRLDPFPD